MPAWFLKPHIVAIALVGTVCAVFSLLCTRRRRRPLVARLDVEMGVVDNPLLGGLPRGDGAVMRYARDSPGQVCCYWVTVGFLAFIAGAAATGTCASV